MPIEQPAQGIGQIDTLSGLDVFLRSLGFLGLAIVILVVLAVVVGYVWMIWMRNKDREERSLDFVLLQVAVPRDNEIKIDAAEQMFSSIYSIYKSSTFSFFKPQDHLSLEIVAWPEQIRFYISCPRNIQDLVEKQIHGAYPGADVKVVDEYNIFSEDGKLAFAALKLKSADYLPIKTYKELATDSLSQITSALAKMQPGEGAAIQILTSPANTRWRASGKRFVTKTKESELTPKTEGKASVPDPKKMEAIEKKTAKIGVNVVIRIVVSAKTEEQAKVHVDNIKSTFAQFSSDYNGFSTAGIRFKKQFLIDFVYRYVPLFGNFGVLNAEELSSIFHLPNKTVETPGIFWVYAKRAPAPSQLPTSGLHLGRSAYRGITREIFLADDDRRRHIYIVGKTGTGKTEQLKHMILQDIRAGHGVAFIDPHGDAAEDLLSQIPAERAEDVIYFNPADTDRPIGMNMLEAETEQEKHFVATYIVGLMYKPYDPHKTGIIGPRFEHAIRNAMLTVMSEAGNTFVEVVRVLTDAKFVQELLPKVTDPVVRRYWTDQIAQTADFHKR